MTTTPPLPTDPSTPSVAPDQGDSDIGNAARSDVERDDKPQAIDREMADNPALQGEGNYSAARRHRESLKDFIDAGKVEPAARRAAPETAQQARELQDAQAEGLAHARR